MGETRIVLCAAMAVVAIALALVLSSSPPAVTRAHGPVASAFDFGRTRVRSKICQAGETMPAGTTAIRVWLEAVTVEALSGSHVLARGARGAGWTAGSVTIPVGPSPRRSSQVTVCVDMAQAREPIDLQGVRTAKKVAAFDIQSPLSGSAQGQAATQREGPLPGRIVIEYLRAGKASWWSLARSVARRMGLGHAGSGPAIPLLALALMVAVAVVMSRVILKELI
jgi:hypothetical protein